MEKLSFNELVNKYVIIIPMLQRDYAYGRMDEAEKRDSFLRNLKRFIADKNQHDLDFVYGSVDQNNILTLLDGQQRITTLFLLHWYLSLVIDSSGSHHYNDFREMMIMPNGESKFSYKTRFSSSDFCNAIVSFGIEGAEKYSEIINNPSPELSKRIKSEKWYLPHWNYDPTIISMLNMLDSIASLFSPDECRDYYERLVNRKQLVFSFLNLEDYNLSDDLYIKMNSRGRALTRFESLKSKILRLYDEAQKKVPQKYNDAIAKVKSVSTDGSSFSTLRDYVSLMLDTKWTDVFWNEWLNDPNHDDIPNVDGMMLSFISTMAIFDHIVFKLNGRMSLGRQDILTKEVNDLMSAKDKNKGITIRYDKMMELFTENEYAFLFKIIDYFNIISGDGKLKTYLPSTFDLYDEREAFHYLSNDYKYGMEYERKSKLFAYIKYLSTNPQPQQELLVTWMRFVCHVCSNSYTLANYTDTFCTSLAGLSYLYDKDIANAIMSKDISEIVTLDIPQIEEEILKMKLATNVDWKVLIDDAEAKLSYFEGRLRFPLIECCHIDETCISNDKKRAMFEEYVTKMAAIFPDEHGCNCENELIRALLSKGNYLMFFGSNNSLLKNNDRDNSWRRFLKEAPKDNNAYHPFGTVGYDKRIYFKEVLDDPLFDSSNAKDSLVSIAESRTEDIPMWRKLIIDCKEILENSDVDCIGRDRNIRWNNDITEYNHKKDSEDNYEIDLIPGSAITGYHAELFSLAKYYELKNKTFKTWGTLQYARTKTTVEQPYFYLGDHDCPFLKVLYQDDNSFIFSFDDGTEKSDVPYRDVEKEILTIAP